MGDGGVSEILRRTRTVRLGGAEIEIREVSLRQVEEFDRLACAALESTQGILAFDVPTLMRLLGRNAEPFAALVSLCSAPQIPADQVLSLPAGEAAELIAAACEVNLDFFGRRLPQIVIELADSRNGETSSRSSLSTATDTAPSSTIPPA